MPVRHVVLVTYGEPPAPAFSEQLAYSWRILLGLTRTIAPIPKPLLPIIALARARGRTRLWTAETYRSPLEPITHLQADRIRTALRASQAAPAPDWRVHVAYEFRRPLVAEALGAIPSDEPVWIVPMYAADSAFTHTLSRDVVARLGGTRARSAPVEVAAALDAERLGEISAAHVLDALLAHPGWTGPGVALVLAAHGTLLDPPRPADTGLDATLRLCGAIRRRLAPSFGLIVNGWLNHARGGRWTEPPIDEALQRVAGAGFSRVVYFPYGFLADNAESQLEGRLALRGQPSLDALHLPCLNESAGLAEAIARQILTAARAGA
jgi:protoheme ferro-lyase